MKALFDHVMPFMLAGGGFEIQLRETMSALQDLGVEVEHLRSSDSGQRGDIIHFFGRPSAEYIRFAHQKNIPVVMSELLTGMGSRPRRTLLAQQTAIRLIRKTVPYNFWSRMGWDSFALADRLVALTEWEAHLMTRLFAAPPDRIRVIPNGVSPEFLQENNAVRENYLVCTATITPRKRIVETVEAAILAQTPIWVIGEPYGATDSYADKFLELARQHPEIIRYEGAVRERSFLADIYRHARGFVLLSSMESLSLSALEAAACGCPLFLSDLPWARTTFKQDATYCPLAGARETADRLRDFHHKAPALPVPPKPASWSRVAQELVKIYSELSAP